MVGYGMGKGQKEGENGVRLWRRGKKGLRRNDERVRKGVGKGIKKGVKRRWMGCGGVRMR